MILICLVVLAKAFHNWNPGAMSLPKLKFRPQYSNAKDRVDAAPVAAQKAIPKAPTAFVNDNLKSIAVQTSVGIPTMSKRVEEAANFDPEDYTALKWFIHERKEQKNMSIDKHISAPRGDISKIA